MILKHVMMDCYGSTQKLLEDLRYFNKVMNEIPYVLHLPAVTPPNLVPYYYGKIKKDEGTSAFVILEGGHFTVHAFPLRSCYFLDIFGTDFETQPLIDYLLENLPYNQAISAIEERNRDTHVFNTKDYDPQEDFGPHILCEVQATKQIEMEVLFDFLENRVYEIGMTPITRPYILKSTIKNTKFLSGIILIAESHIALHYDYEKKNIYFDIFSCAPFDFTSISEILSELGDVISDELVIRGNKHYSKIKLYDTTLENISSEQWHKNIHK
jgi:S-adenosylmethionine/arginine decarboxylase-like enzyme